MDFITHLPSSKGMTTIWVIVDRLTKSTHFISLPSHYSATTSVSIFLTKIYKLHSMPKTIISDYDCLFVSKFGVTPSTYKALLWHTTMPTIRKRMDKLKSPTRFWRPSWGALLAMGSILTISKVLVQHLLPICYLNVTLHYFIWLNPTKSLHLCWGFFCGYIFGYYIGPTL